MPIVLFAGIGLISGFLAGLVAFLITLNEGVHHYQTLREPIKVSLRTGLLTFAFFFGLSILLGFLMPFVLQ